MVRQYEYQPCIPTRGTDHDGYRLTARRESTASENGDTQGQPTLLRCVAEPSDHPITGPKLNRLIIEQRLGLFDSFAVIVADDFFEVCEMPVMSDGISPVLCHCSSPRGLNIALFAGERVGSHFSN
jgi:hypothetical protein